LPRSLAGYRNSFERIVPKLVTYDGQSDGEAIPWM
jgi:hypothetical protein